MSTRPHIGIGQLAVFLGGGDISKTFTKNFKQKTPSVGTFVLNSLGNLVIFLYLSIIWKISAKVIMHKPLPVEGFIFHSLQRKDIC